MEKLKELRKIGGTKENWRDDGKLKELRKIGGTKENWRNDEKLEG